MGRTRIRSKVAHGKHRKPKRVVRKPDLVDRVEKVVRRTPVSVVNRMEPTVRELALEMVDLEATVVHME